MHGERGRREERERGRTEERERGRREERKRGYVREKLCDELRTASQNVDGITGVVMSVSVLICQRLLPFLLH